MQSSVTAREMTSGQAADLQLDGFGAGLEGGDFGPAPPNVAFSYGLSRAKHLHSLLRCTPLVTHIHIRNNHGGDVLWDDQAGQP